MESDESEKEGNNQGQLLDPMREFCSEHVDRNSSDTNTNVVDDFDDFEAGAEDEDFGDFDEGFQESSSPELEPNKPQSHVSALPSFATREPSLVSKIDTSVHIACRILDEGAMEVAD